MHSGFIDTVSLKCILMCSSVFCSRSNLGLRRASGLPKFQRICLDLSCMMRKSRAPNGDFCLQ